MNARAFWRSVTRVLLLCMMALFLHSLGPSLRFLTICQTFPASWLSSTFRFQISFFFSVIRSLTSSASLYRGSSLCRFCFASSRCLIASSISVVIHIGVLLLTFLRPMCSYAALQMQVLRAFSMRSGLSREGSGWLLQLLPGMRPSLLSADPTPLSLSLSPYIQPCCRRW